MPCMVRGSSRLEDANMAKETAKPGKEYLKRDEQEALFGAEFLTAFDKAREQHNETWRKLTAMAAQHVQAPEGHELKLTPGFGDTLGVTFVPVKRGNGKTGAATVADRLAKLGVAVKAPASPLLGPDKKPKAVVPVPELPPELDRRAKPARKGIGSH